MYVTIPWNSRELAIKPYYLGLILRILLKTKSELIKIIFSKYIIVVYFFQQLFQLINYDFFKFIAGPILFIENNDYKTK